jgi:hypothetical protein
MAWNRHAIVQTQLRKHVASMAWGARNLISTQVRLIMPTSTRSAARCTAWPSPRARRGWSKLSGVSPCCGASTSGRSTWGGDTARRRFIGGGRVPRSGRASGPIRFCDGARLSLESGDVSALGETPFWLGRVWKPAHASVYFANFSAPGMNLGAAFTKRGAIQNCSRPAARPAFATTAHTPSSWPRGRCPRRTGTSPPAAQ